jgi:hypothetical protein
MKCPIISRRLLVPINDRRLAAVLMIPFFLFLLQICAFGQDDQDIMAPPPLTLISKAEQAKLDGAKGTKDRTKAALALMDTRLATAESLLAKNDFYGIFQELGAFQGLLDNQLDYLIKRDNDSGRILDNFKRLEIGLRGFTPRIESLRREMPYRFEPFVRSVGKYLRDARSKALEPLFSDTVVRTPNGPN